MNSTDFRDKVTDYFSDNLDHIEGHILLAYVQQNLDLNHDKAGKIRMKTEMYLNDFNVDPKMEPDTALDLVINLIKLDVKTEATSLPNTNKTKS